MRVITVEQSQRLAAEIYAQGCRLDDAADQYRSPWGDLMAERLRRLSNERFAAAGCNRQPWIDQ